MKDKNFSDLPNSRNKFPPPMFQEVIGIDLPFIDRANCKKHLRDYLLKLTEHRCLNCGEYAHEKTRNASIQHDYYIEEETLNFLKDTHAAELPKKKRVEEWEYPVAFLSILCGDCHAGMPSSRTHLTPNFGYIELAEDTSSSFCVNRLSNNNLCGKNSTKTVPLKVIFDSSNDHKMTVCFACAKLKCQKNKLTPHLNFIKEIQGIVIRYFETHHKSEFPWFNGQFPEYDAGKRVTGIGRRPFFIYNYEKIHDQLCHIFPAIQLGSNITKPSFVRQHFKGKNKSDFLLHHKSDLPFYCVVELIICFNLLEALKQLEGSSKDKDSMYMEGLSILDCKKILNSYANCVRETGSLNLMNWDPSNEPNLSIH